MYQSGQISFKSYRSNLDSLTQEERRTNEINYKAFSGGSQAFFSLLVLWGQADVLWNPTLVAARYSRSPCSRGSRFAAR